MHKIRDSRRRNFGSIERTESTYFRVTRSTRYLHHLDAVAIHSYKICEGSADFNSSPHPRSPLVISERSAENGRNCNRVKKMTDSLYYGCKSVEPLGAGNRGGS